MEHHNEQYEELIQKFTVWALGCDDMRAAIIVGSRARLVEIADEWSDLDLVMFVNSPNDYIRSTFWLDNIAPYWITFVETTAVGGSKERRVLFDGGLDVDFSVFPVQAIHMLSGQPEAMGVFQRGFRALVDKDHLLNDLLAQMGDIPNGTSLAALNALPTEEEFTNLVDDFWYHTVWGVKKLRRGETWMAKSNVDNYLKGLLLKMCEWHAMLTNGPGYDTWHGGRYFDRWVDHRVKEALATAFAYYNEDDIVRALRSTIQLFSWVAAETAERLGYQYSVLAETKAIEWIDEHVGTRSF